MENSMLYFNLFTRRCRFSLQNLITVFFISFFTPKCTTFSCKSGSRKESPGELNATLVYQIIPRPSVEKVYDF